MRPWWFLCAVISIPGVLGRGQQKQGYSRSGSWWVSLQFILYLCGFGHLNIFSVNFRNPGLWVLCLLLLAEWNLSLLWRALSEICFVELSRRFIHSTYLRVLGNLTTILAITGFEQAIQGYAIHVLSITYQRLPRSILAEVSGRTICIKAPLLRFLKGFVWQEGDPGFRSFLEDH